MTALAAILLLTAAALAVWLFAPALNTYVQVRHVPFFRYTPYEFERPDLGYPVDRTGSREMVRAGYYARPPFDGRGIPVTDYRWMRDRAMPAGRYHNAGTVAQWALWGCYLPFLRSGEPALRDEFLEQAGWLLDRQTPEGAYPNDFALPARGLGPGWVSGMYQGLAASALVRAYLLTRDERFLEGARRAVLLMLRPMPEGGALVEDDGVWLEEYPERVPGHVLNGLVFAWWGLYDVCAVAPDPKMESTRDAVAATLLEHLGSYTSAEGVLYELGSPRTVDGDGYLALQAEQMIAMAGMTGSPRFREVGEAWRSRVAPTRVPGVIGAAARALFSAAVYRARGLVG